MLTLKISEHNITLMFAPQPLYLGLCVSDNDTLHRKLCVNSIIIQYDIIDASDVSPHWQSRINTDRPIYFL